MHPVLNPDTHTVQTASQLSSELLANVGLLYLAARLRAVWTADTAGREVPALLLLPSMRKVLPRKRIALVFSRMMERYDCHYCKDSLLGKKYVQREENPYCVKCYNSLYSNTCEECKKPIGCDSRATDKPFTTKNEQLLCTECYANEYSSKCYECKKTIMPGSQKMEHKGNSWHETCFTCKRCQQLIGTKSFIPNDNSIYCVPCYEKQFALQCVQCKKPITTGGVTYHEQPWHKDCFLCTGCKEQLAGQRFTSQDGFPYCLTCYCNLYAKKCAFCTSPISGLGGSKYISFEERQWHHDCFNCTKCAVSLVGRGFLTEKDSILCPECGKNI
ncbi:four and a half LIM domains 2b [Silurus asotus]|uniref:Four and a half LIM domains 2b n=1 Tax=Silurus asotus TaxID=30991 RepID=A0AAD5ACJ7_SILAS|nr:four and a half LIM domains 2b [Silurus asotus]